MTDRIVRAVLTGSAVGAVAAFGEVAVAAERAGASAAKSAEASGARTSGAWSQMGHAATVAAVAITAAAVVAAGVAVKMAADFQQVTTTLVTGAGESVKNIDMIRQGILALAPVVGTTPVELAKGLYMIESAGFHGAAALDILKASAEGAKVGMADQATVANVLTSALNAYNLPASAAVSVTNDLVATVARGKMHMQDLAQAVAGVLAPAAALGVKLPEVSGAIATMTMQGTDASRAAQSLRFMLASLAGPTSAAAKEFQALGVGESEIPGITKAASDELQKLGLHTSDVAYTLTHQGLQAALTMITDAIGKQFPAGSAQYEAALRAAVGGTRGFTAALELTNTHAAVFTANVDAISAAAQKGGSSVSGWALIQQDFNQKLDQARAAVEVVAIKVGTALLPMLSTLATWFANVGLPTLERWGTWLYNNLINPAIHVAQVVIPPLITALGWVFDKLSAIKVPLLVIAGVLATMWAVDKIHTWMSAATSAVSGVLGRTTGGAIGSSGSSMVGVQKVWVVNMPGGGIPGGGAGTGGAAGEGESLVSRALGTARTVGTVVATRLVPAAAIAAAAYEVVSHLHQLGQLTADHSARTLNYYNAEDAAQGAGVSAVQQATTANTKTAALFNQLQGGSQGFLDHVSTNFGGIQDALNQAMGHNEMYASGTLKTGQLAIDLAQLYDQHKITSAGQMQAVLGYWEKTVTASGGVPPTIAQITAFLNGAGATAAQISPALLKAVNAANLGALSGQAFATAVGSLATQTGSSINQIISAYTTTAAYSRQAAAASLAFAQGLQRDANAAANIALGHFAGGGNPYAGQWAVVGEEGPEIVRFPAAAQVFSAPQTKGMLGGFAPLPMAGVRAGFSSGGDVTLNMEIHSSDPTMVRAEIRRAFQEVVVAGRARGRA